MASKVATPTVFSLFYGGSPPLLHFAAVSKVRVGTEKEGGTELFSYLKRNLGISITFILRSDYPSENLRVKVQAMRGKS
jgi:hypothetical protein